MPMRHNGLAKLVEECGELSQVAGKMLQYPELQTSTERHPDGTILLDKLEEEIADVLAAISFVRAKLNLKAGFIGSRATFKLFNFNGWDKEP